MDTGIWHKCSDLMPEETDKKSEVVLVTDKFGCMQWLDYTRTGDWMSSTSRMAGYEAYAWMGIPKFNLK